MIASTVSRMQYAGAGLTGPYAFAFRIFAATDLLVTKRVTAGAETTLSYLSDFVLTAGTTVGDAAGGNITLTVALAVGEVLSIRRVVPLLQPTSLGNQGPYFGATHETAFDRLVAQVQQLDDRVRRSVGVGETYDPATLTLLLPAGETGKVLGWDTPTRLTNKTLDSSAVALPGGGRTTTTLSAYLANNAIFNFDDFGAVGDGTALDGSKLQAAIAAAQAVGGSVTGRKGGQYRFTSQLTVTGTLTMLLDGVTLLPDLVGAGISAINAASSTGAFRVEGGTIKWYGVFGTSLAGGIYVQDYDSATIAHTTVNGLGAPVVSTGFNANLVLRSLRVVEHGNSDIISLGRSGAGLDPCYGVTIEDCFLQFTAATKNLHDCISGSYRHLTVRGGSCEQARFGVNLGTAIGYEYVIDNVFFEACFQDIVLGQDFLNGFYSLLLNGTITRCASSTPSQSAGAGTVSCAAGVAAFSTSQAGLIANGQALLVNGQVYTISGFNGTTGCTLAGGGALTFGAAAFTICPSLFLNILGVVERLDVRNNTMDGAVGINVANHRNSVLHIGLNRGVTPTPLAGFPSIAGPMQHNLSVQTVHPMNDAAQFTKSFDPTGTGALSTVAGLDGGNAVQTVVTGDQVVVLASFPTIDLSAATYLVLMVWISDPTKLYLAADQSGATWNLLAVQTDSANWYYFPMQAYASGKAPILRAGWNEIKLKKSDAIIGAGAPNWNNITRITTTNLPAAAQTTTFKYGGLYAVSIVEGGIIDGASLLARAQTLSLGPARWTSGKATTALPATAIASSRVYHTEPAPGLIDSWVKVVGGGFVAKMLPGMIADVGNNGYVIVVGASPQTLRWGTAITSNKAITLPVAGLFNGLRYEVVRTAAATGAFSIDVGGLISLTQPGQSCIIEYDGTAWYVVSASSLLRAAAIASPTAPSAGYVQAEATSMKTAVDALRVAVQNAGISL